MHLFITRITSTHHYSHLGPPYVYVPACIHLNIPGGTKHLEVHTYLNWSHLKTLLINFIMCWNDIGTQASI